MKFRHSLLILLSLIYLCSSALPTTSLLWPLPSKLSLNETGQISQIDPCAITYKIEANPQDYVKQMLNFYLISIFKCKTLTNGTITMQIVVKNPNQMFAEKVQHQKYSLSIRSTDKWELIADYYVGFLRGLETYSQLFQSTKDGYIINNRPIFIDDIPKFVWRGLMLDSARHFLPINAIKHQIDAILFNKMSIFHWHIIDQDSFPMEIPTRPNISKYGALSGTYSTAQIKQVISYAKTRGIRVIVEIDSPAHTESWGRSPELKQIVVKCNQKYSGQFDPTINLTYDVVVDVMKYINNTFNDAYVHFGGDQINEACYDKKPEIKEWMNKNNISTYVQLSEYYRSRQKSLWRNISSFKKTIYWANQEIDMKLQDDDVVQWWGFAGNVQNLKGRKNQVILSNYDLAYLDLGYGGDDGEGYGDWISWKDLYSFNPIVDKVNVIGGETCMWAQISNENVQDQKIWPRTSVLNQRLWNTDINIKVDIRSIAERLSSHTKRMKERGIKTSPVTVGLCENDPSICW